MKISNNIGTLRELVNWCKKNNPKTIDIGKESKLMEIDNFFEGSKDKLGGWHWFRNIKINYES